MEEILKLLNRLASLGLIGDYAIGGGVATILHSIPYTTRDLDVFTIIPRRSGLVDLGPVWEFLQEAGGVPSGQFMDIKGVCLTS